MTTETATKLKIDDTPCNLFTIKECHDKAGKFPFTIMKMKVVGACTVPLFTTAMITEYDGNYLSLDRITATHRIMDSWTDSRTWTLLK